MLISPARRFIRGSEFPHAMHQLAAWCACSVILASSLAAGEPAQSSPLERLKERSAGDRWHELRSHFLPQKASGEETPVQGEKSLAEKLSLTPPASAEGTGSEVAAPLQTARNHLPSDSPEPLDLPPSSWRGTGALEPFSRPSQPAMVKAVPDPYFENPTPEKQLAQTPLITLPNFLDSPPSVVPLVEPSGESGLVPPAPIAELAQAPDESHTIPGEIDTVFRPITQIQPYYDYSPTGKKPYEYLCPQPNSLPEADRAQCPNIRPLQPTGSIDRHFALTDFHWMATNLHHKPLYFQDVTLERYGQKVPYGLQPFVSLGKFAVQGIGLPYQVAIDPVWRDIYPLGYYRPGDPAPELFYQVPVNLKAAAAAGGVYTGLIFLFP